MHNNPGARPNPRPNAPARPLNPYDFVPLDTQPSRTGHGYQRLDNPAGMSGTILYSLHIHTPLFVHHQTDDASRSFPYYDGKPFIPATSVKGALRTVHEMLANGCVRIAGNAPKDKQGCEDPADLCATCRLFGMAGKAQQATGEAAVAGRVFFYDIPLEEEYLGEIWLPSGHGPQPGHWSFYRRLPSPGRPAGSAPALGRKYYYHHPNYEKTLWHYRHQDQINVTALMPESIVTPTVVTNGELRFIDLTNEELGELLYTLELESGLAHKIGYGKPYGLGTVRIEVTSLDVQLPANDARLNGEPTEISAPARFLNYGQSDFSLMGEKDTLRYEARRAWAARAGLPQQSFQAFSALAWRDQGTKQFIYPTYGWFHDNNRANSTVRLHTYQHRANIYAERDLQVPVIAPRPDPIAPIQGGGAPIQPQPPIIQGEPTGRVTGHKTLRGKEYIKIHVATTRETLWYRLSDGENLQINDQVYFTKSGERLDDNKMLATDVCKVENTQP